MTKKIASYTIDIGLLKEFEEFAANHAINKSALIEKLIREHLQAQKKLKN